MRRSDSGGADRHSAIVSAANEPVPPAKRIDDRLIVRVAADRPLPRTAKQSIPRPLAVKLLAAEIEAAYGRLSDAS